jgi:predicted aspartyl protease
MSSAFDPHQGLIIVNSEIVGVSGTAVLRLALDTGATTTLINSDMLLSIGYDSAGSESRVQITTASGLEEVPQINVKRLTALGKELTDFPVLSFTLPPTSGVDGLLGLDFLRVKRLEVDFRNGSITLD